MGCGASSSAAPHRPTERETTREFTDLVSFKKPEGPASDAPKKPSHGTEESKTPLAVTKSEESASDDPKTPTKIPGSVDEPKTSSEFTESKLASPPTLNAKSNKTFLPIVSLLMKNLRLTATTAQQMASLQNPLLRIFISSTFTDTTAEKNEFMKLVYPYIHQICDASGTGLRFEAVDMRWGVTDNLTKDHMTWEMCLSELIRCSELSMGRYFFCLYAQKYGWRPIPRLIDASLFDKILAAADTDSATLLEKWYLSDNNCVPAMRTLQPLDHTSAQNWWGVDGTCETLRRALETAGKIAQVTNEESLAWTVSVTEQEIRQAIEFRQEGDRAVWFRRKIQNVEKFPTEKKYAYLANDDEVPFLETLEKDLQPKFEKTILWETDVETLLDPTEEYKKKVCEYFRVELEKDARQALSQLESVAWNDPGGRALIREVVHHISMLTERSSEYLPISSRKSVLDEAVSHLSSGTGCLAVMAPSGAGKTSLLAAAVANVSNLNQTISVVRFLGTSQASSSVRSLLTSIYRQLLIVTISKENVDENREWLSRAVSWTPPDRMGELLEELLKLIRGGVSAGKKICLVLDSLDQLSDGDAGGTISYDWIFNLCAAGAVVLVSGLRDEGLYSYRIAESLSEIFAKGEGKTKLSISDIVSLNEIDVRDLIGSHLDKNHRTLTPAQRGILEQKMYGQGTLYFNLLMEEAKRWTSYREIQTGEVEGTVQGLIGARFQEMEAVYGPEVVSSVLGVLSSSRVGLSPREIVDVLSTDVELLRDRGPVFQWHTPGLRVFPSTIWQRIAKNLEWYLTGLGVVRWYHRQHAEVAQKRYLGNEETKKKYHRMLAEYFSGFRDEALGGDVIAAMDPQPWVLNGGSLGVGHTVLKDVKNPVVNSRKATEFFYHARESGEISKYARLLLTADYLESRARCQDTFRMVEDFKWWSEAPHTDTHLRNAVTHTYKFLKKYASAIHKDPSDLASLYLATPAADKLSRHNYSYPRIGRVLPVRNWGADLAVITGHNDDVRGVAFSSDSQRVVSCSFDKTVRIFDATSGEEKLLIPSQEKVYCVDVSSTQIAAGLINGNLNVWNFGGEILFASETGYSPTYSVAFSPDSSKYIAGNGSYLYLFSSADGKRLKKLSPHSSEIRGVSWSPCGGKVASAAKDTKAIVTDIESEKELFSLKHEGNVFSAKFSPSGEYLATSGEDLIIFIWSLADGTLAKKLEGHTEQLYCAVWSPDSLRIASCGFDMSVMVWDVASAKKTAMHLGHASIVFGASWSSTGDKLASASGDGSVRVWDVTPTTGGAGDEEEEEERPIGHTDYVYSVHFSKSGSRLLTSGKDKLVKIWDVETGKEIRTFTGHDDCVYFASFSADETKIASGSADKNAIVWEVETGKILHTLRGHTKRIFATDWTKDSKQIATGGADRAVKIWDAETGNEIKNLDPGSDGSSLQFSPDGKFLAAAGAGAGIIKIWETQTWEMKYKLEKDCHSQYIMCVFWSPDGNQLVSSSYDETIKLWDVKTQKCLNTISKHEGEVYYVAFSPDGTKLASASLDFTVKVFDSASGEELASLTGHTRNVMSVGWSPDGKKIASGSSDMSTRIWDLEELID